MKAVLNLLRAVWRAGAFSPMAFVVRAIGIAVLFGVSELLGLREYTTFLSGTSPNPGISWQVAAILGLELSDPAKLDLLPQGPAALGTRRRIPSVYFFGRA